MLHLFTMLLSSKEYLVNPYLRAKLVETFCSLADNADNAQATFDKQPPRNDLRAVLSTCPFLVRHLLPSLVRLYVEIEHTGSDAQFYTKFNVRHAIAVLVQWCAQYAPHVAVLERQATTAPDLFVRFTHSVLNDVVYLLDESLIKATMLRVAQQEATTLPFAQRRENQERQALLARALHTASVLAVPTVQLLALLAHHPQTRAILNRPEMLDRVVQFINQFTTKVCRPQRRPAVTVSDARTRAFKPDEWLKIFLLGVYSDLRKGNADFVQTLAKDSSSFVADDLQAACGVLEQAGGAQSEELVDFATLVGEAREYAESASSHAAVLGDVPDQYLDGLLSTLLTDPVLLPSSSVTVNRATITRHLLNAPTDPFDRTPLTEGQTPREGEAQREARGVAGIDACVQWLTCSRSFFLSRSHVDRAAGSQGRDRRLDRVAPEALGRGEATGGSQAAGGDEMNRPLTTTTTAAWRATSRRSTDSTPSSSTWT